MNSSLPKSLPNKRHFNYLKPMTAIPIMKEDYHFPNPHLSFPNRDHARISRLNFLNLDEQLNNRPNTTDDQHHDHHHEEQNKKIKFNRFIERELPFSPRNRKNFGTSSKSSGNEEDQMKENPTKFDPFSDFPDFITQKTIVREEKSQKMINELKKSIKMKEFQLKYQVLLKSAKKTKSPENKFAAKDAYYLVYQFEKDVETDIFSKLKGKTVKVENEAKNPLKTFQIRHKKTIETLKTFFKPSETMKKFKMKSVY